MDDIRMTELGLMTKAEIVEAYADQICEFDSSWPEHHMVHVVAKWLQAQNAIPTFTPWQAKVQVCEACCAVINYKAKAQRFCAACNSAMARSLRVCSCYRPDDTGWRWPLYGPCAIHGATFDVTSLPDTAQDETSTETDRWMAELAPLAKTGALAATWNMLRDSPITWSLAILLFVAAMVWLGAH